MDNLIKEMKDNLDKTIQSHKHYKSTKHVSSGIIMAVNILRLKETIEKALKELETAGVDTNRIQI